MRYSTKLDFYFRNNYNEVCCLSILQSERRGWSVSENLDFEIENSIKEAMDDAELSAKLFKSKNAREFYHILSANKDLGYSYDDFYDYFLYCQKLASFFLSNEKPYSKKTIELVKIYSDICKNDKELDKFNSLKTTNDVLMYFNSLGSSRYSIDDVVEFFRFRYSVIFKRLEISIARFHSAISKNQRLVDESRLKCAGGIGNKGRWVSGVLGALSMMSSGFGEVNMVSAHPFGYRGNIVDDVANASGKVRSVEQTKNLDFYVDDEPNAQLSENNNNSNGEVTGLSGKAVACTLLGVLGAGLIKQALTKAGLGEYAPKDLNDLMKLPDLLKKAEESGKKLSNKFDKSGAINQGQRINQLIRNSNDAIYNILATHVKGQEKPIQDIVDLGVCPFISNIGERSSIKMNFFNTYGYYPNNDPTPEGSSFTLVTVHGDKGLGKTRLWNILQQSIFGPAQIPSMYIAVGGFDGDESSKTFEEFLSKQDCFVRSVSDIEYSRRFAFCFDEVDKIKDPKKRANFMEYVRMLNDKTQISYKEVGSDGKFTGRTNVIQGEVGFGMLLSNAVGLYEKNAAAWRQTSLTDDQSMLSRMIHIVYNPANDDTADAVMDTLIMEVQRSWYEANEINVEVDDTFTYNSLAVLKYLGYDPNKDGVREVKNQIIPAMKTEFSRKYTRLLEKYNRLVAEGKDPRKIRFLFRWEKVNINGDGVILRGKNGKMSPVVPVLSCKYVDDVNTLSVRVFNHRFDTAAGSSTIWKPLYKSDVDNFRDFMGRLESWKLWANQCRVEDMKQGINEVAKYKIRDVYRMLRFCAINMIASHYGRDISAKNLMRILKKWRKVARLTVSERNLLFEGLSEMIEQWRVRAGDGDTPSGTDTENDASEKKREEEQKKQEEAGKKKLEEEKKKQEKIERKKREEEKKKQEEIERKKQERAERKRLEKEEKERKKREKEEKKKREKEEKERKKREKEEKKKREKEEKKKQKSNDVPGGKVRPNAIEEENRKEEKKMPN